MDKQKLQDFLNDQALSIPDIQDPVPYVSGTVRGKKWVPPPMPKDNIGKLISRFFFQKTRETDERKRSVARIDS